MSERLNKINSQLHSQRRLIKLRNQSKINIGELFDTLVPPFLGKYLQQIYNIINNNPGLFRHAHLEQMSKDQQRYLSTMQCLQIIKSYHPSNKEDEFKVIAGGHALCFFGIGIGLKAMLPYFLYTKTLMTFGINQYHEEAYNNAIKGEHVGSFGLTELYHGSFIRGIRTQAVYDKQTKEFIVTTNGEEGMKFWIGGTAQTASKTVMWAQLIVDGENYGPHPFLMDLRDSKTHQVVQGIIVGDVGPKGGLNAIDNGYIMVKNVRIPRKALLGKLGAVDQIGKYVSPIKNNEQRFGLHMSPLSSGRALASFECLSQSIGALTTAIRYACERRQFFQGNSSQQKLIIDYPSMRLRILLPLAVTVISYFPAVLINKFYVQNSKNFIDPSKKIITQLHAASAVIKSKTSWYNYSVLSQCRQVLGGHGYSEYSGLGRYYHDNQVNATGEGDNNMLLQQTSKNLLKIIKDQEPGSIIDMKFIYEGPQDTTCIQDEKSLIDFANLRLLIQEIFLIRLNAAVTELSAAREEGKQKGIPASHLGDYAWNRVQPHFCNQMALSYGDLIYFQSAMTGIINCKNEHNRTFLQNCLKIWAHNLLLKTAFNKLETRKILQQLILKGCQAIYPDCVAVTDTLAAPNYVIGSPFAREDGDCMKEYLTMIMSGKNTFRRVPWFDKLIKLRENSQL